LERTRVRNLRKRIEILIDSIRNEELRRIVKEIFENPKLSSYSVDPTFTLEESPGEIIEHHSYPGGLLEHTLSVTLIARFLTRLYKKIYGMSVDIDLVTACSLLHDVFKVYEYEIDNETGGYKRNRSTYIPHDYLIVGELILRNAPLRVIRCLSEVHGYTGYTMFESLIVSKADQLDAYISKYIQESIMSLIDKKARRDVLMEFYELLKKTRWKDLFDKIFLP